MASSANICSIQNKHLKLGTLHISLKSNIILCSPSPTRQTLLVFMFHRLKSEDLAKLSNRTVFLFNYV